MAMQRQASGPARAKQGPAWPPSKEEKAPAGWDGPAAVGTPVLQGTCAGLCNDLVLQGWSMQQLDLKSTDQSRDFYTKLASLVRHHDRGPGSGPVTESDLCVGHPELFHHGFLQTLRRELNKLVTQSLASWVWLVLEQGSLSGQWSLEQLADTVVYVPPGTRPAARSWEKGHTLGCNGRDYYFEGFLQLSGEHPYELSAVSWWDLCEGLARSLQQPSALGGSWASLRDTVLSSATRQKAEALLVKEKSPSCPPRTGAQDIEEEMEEEILLLEKRVLEECAYVLAKPHAFVCDAGPRVTSERLYRPLVLGSVPPAVAAWPWERSPPLASVLQPKPNPSATGVAGARALYIQALHKYLQKHPECLVLANTLDNLAGRPVVQAPQGPAPPPLGPGALWLASENTFIRKAPREGKSPSLRGASVYLRVAWRITASQAPLHSVPLSFAGPWHRGGLEHAALLPWLACHEVLHYVRCAAWITESEQPATTLVVSAPALRRGRLYVDPYFALCRGVRRYLRTERALYAGMCITRKTRFSTGRVEGVRSHEHRSQECKRQAERIIAMFGVGEDGEDDDEDEERGEEELTDDEQEEADEEADEEEADEEEADEEEEEDLLQDTLGETYYNQENRGMVEDEVQRTNSDPSCLAVRDWVFCLLLPWAESESDAWLRRNIPPAKTGALPYTYCPGGAGVSHEQIQRWALSQAPSSESKLSVRLEVGDYCSAAYEGPRVSDTASGATKCVAPYFPRAQPLPVGGDRDPQWPRTWDCMSPDWEGKRPLHAARVAPVEARYCYTWNYFREACLGNPRILRAPGEGAPPSFAHWAKRTSAEASRAPKWGVLDLLPPDAKQHLCKPPPAVRKILGLTKHDLLHVRSVLHERDFYVRRLRQVSAAPYGLRGQPSVYAGFACQQPGCRNVAVDLLLDETAVEGGRAAERQVLCDDHAPLRNSSVGRYHRSQFFNYHEPASTRLLDDIACKRPSSRSLALISLNSMLADLLEAGERQENACQKHLNNLQDAKRKHAPPASDEEHEVVKVFLSQFRRLGGHLEDPAVYGLRLHYTALHEQVKHTVKGNGMRESWRAFAKWFQDKQYGSQYCELAKAELPQNAKHTCAIRDLAAYATRCYASPTRANLRGARDGAQPWNTQHVPLAHACQLELFYNGAPYPPENLPTLFSWREAKREEKGPDAASPFASSSGAAEPRDWKAKPVMPVPGPEALPLAERRHHWYRKLAGVGVGVGAAVQPEPEHAQQAMGWLRQYELALGAPFVSLRKACRDVMSQDLFSNLKQQSDQYASLYLSGLSVARCLVADCQETMLLPASYLAGEYPVQHLFLQPSTPKLDQKPSMFDSLLNYWEKGEVLIPQGEKVKEDFIWGKPDGYLPYVTCYLCRTHYRNPQHRRALLTQFVRVAEELLFPASPSVPSPPLG